MTPSALRQLALANRDFETNAKAREFCDVARWLMVGKGNLGTTVHAAKGAGASERVIEGIKAASQAGTTSDVTYAGPLAY